MEKKKINEEKILNSIAREEKYLKEKDKQFFYNRQLKTSQRVKLWKAIEKSEANLTKLKDKLK